MRLIGTLVILAVLMIACAGGSASEDRVLVLDDWGETGWEGTEREFRLEWRKALTEMFRREALIGISLGACDDLADAEGRVKDATPPPSADKERALTIMREECDRFG